MATFRKRSGKWQARVKRRGHTPISRTFSDRGAAEKWARAVERDIDLGATSPKPAPPCGTLAELLARYRREVSPTKRGGELEVIRLKALEKRPVAGCRLEALTPQVIAAYRDSRLREVQPTTVNRDLDDLSAVLSHARREWGMPISNPVSDIRRPPRRRGRDRVLSHLEERQLVEALSSGGRAPSGTFLRGTRNPWVLPAVRLAIATAMRRGEILALLWKHVDLAAKVVHLPLTKNGDCRDVPLSSTAIQVLSALPKHPSGRVIPVSPMALRKAFERATVAAGLSNLHFHDLRHTATTRIATRLSNVLELSAVTGHRDLRMLQRYYHPNATELARKLG